MSDIFSECGQPFIEICFQDWVLSRGHAGRFEFKAMPERWRHVHDFLTIGDQGLCMHMEQVKLKLLARIANRPGIL